MLGLSLILIGTVPAHALRQVEADEGQGKAQEQLRSRLGVPNQGNFPGGSLSPLVLPVEEVAPEIPQVRPAPTESSSEEPQDALTVQRTDLEEVKNLLADPQSVVSVRLEAPGFVQVPGGILARGDLGKLSGEVFIQAGLEEPIGMPEAARLVWVNESSVSGMLALLNALGVGSRDSVLLNGQVFSRNEATAVLPITHPMPASAVLSPQMRVSAQELAVILYVSQATGMLYVIGVAELTWPGHSEKVLYIRRQN